MGEFKKIPFVDLRYRFNEASETWTKRGLFIVGTGLLDRFIGGSPKGTFSMIVVGSLLCFTKASMYKRNMREVDHITSDCNALSHAVAATNLVEKGILIRESYISDAAMSSYQVGIPSLVIHPKLSFSSTCIHSIETRKRVNMEHAEQTLKRDELSARIARLLEDV